MNYRISHLSSIIILFSLCLVVSSASDAPPSNCLKVITVNEVIYDYDIPLGIPEIGELAEYDPSSANVVSNPTVGCEGDDTFCCAIIDMSTDCVISVYDHDL